MSAITCYCELWATAPETLRAAGVPQGFCGICATCGQPGHTRAHPHAPSTDAWCDACYSKLSSASGWGWSQWVIAALLLVPPLVLMWRALA